MKVNWKYTIGEIVIVIIGITIAFSLNSWKESRTNARLQKQYYENLVLDVEQEIIQLQQNNQKILGNLDLIKMIRPYFGNDRPGRDTMSRKVFQLGQLINFYPENTTYQTLINSGDMNLIDNFQLRRSLEEHNALHKIILSDYQRIEKIHEKYLGDFFIYNMDFRDLYAGKTTFMDDPLLANIISSIEGAYYLILSGNERCIKSDEALLKDIKNELERIS